MAITYMDETPEKLPELGHLRKGTKKKKITNKQGREVEIQGDDLRYFRFDTQNASLEARFAALYPHEPNDIEIILPYASIAENFDYWHEEYSAGALRHRCDSETCVLLLRPDGTYNTEPVKCPGGCKATARLHVLIPALGKLGTITVSTTSGNDIRNLRANLQWLYSQRGNLSGMPLILRRVEKEISTPEIDKQGNRTGKRLRRKKWLIQIEMQEKFATALLQAQQDRALAGIAGALSPANQLALNAAPEDLDEEDDDVIEGEAVEKPATDFLQTASGARLAAYERMLNIWTATGKKAEDWPAYRAANLDKKTDVAVAFDAKAWQKKFDDKRAEAEESATSDDLLASIGREHLWLTDAGMAGEIDAEIAKINEGEVVEFFQLDAEKLPALLTALVEMRTALNSRKAKA